MTVPKMHKTKVWSYNWVLQNAFRTTRDSLQAGQNWPKIHLSSPTWRRSIPFLCSGAYLGHPRWIFLKTIQSILHAFSFCCSYLLANTVNFSPTLHSEFRMSSCFQISFNCPNHLAQVVKRNKPPEAKSLGLRASGRVEISIPFVCFGASSRSYK